MRRFETERLAARDWRPDLDDPSGRAALERSLRAILGARVLEHLPPALQLADGAAPIADWIDARAAQGDVMLVSDAGSEELIGLLFLARRPDGADPPQIHVGYLLREEAWGEGLATELVRGLVSALEGRGPARLLGGVGKGNAASARVLEKAGFVRDPGLSRPDVEMFARSIA